MPWKMREVGQSRECEAGQDDRFAADLVGQPAEQDEERRAERKADRDQDLAVSAGTFRVGVRKNSA